MTRISKNKILLNRLAIILSPLTKKEEAVYKAVVTTCFKYHGARLFDIEFRLSRDGDVPLSMSSIQRVIPSLLRKRVITQATTVHDPDTPCLFPRKLGVTFMPSMGIKTGINLSNWEKMWTPLTTEQIEKHLGEDDD